MISAHPNGLSSGGEKGGEQRQNVRHCERTGSIMTGGASPAAWKAEEVPLESNAGSGRRTDADGGRPGGTNHDGRRNRSDRPGPGALRCSAIVKGSSREAASRNERRSPDRARSLVVMLSVATSGGVGCRPCTASKRGSRPRRQRNEREVRSLGSNDGPNRRILSGRPGRLRSPWQPRALRPSAPSSGPVRGTIRLCDIRTRRTANKRWPARPSTDHVRERERARNGLKGWEDS
jgi:hypothetical protein